MHARQWLYHWATSSVPSPPFFPLVSGIKLRTSRLPGRHLCHWALSLVLLFLKLLSNKCIVCIWKSLFSLALWCLLFSYLLFYTRDVCKYFCLSRSSPMAAHTVLCTSCVSRVPSWWTERTISCNHRHVLALGTIFILQWSDPWMCFQCTSALNLLSKCQPGNCLMHWGIDKPPSTAPCSAPKCIAIYSPDKGCIYLAGKGTRLTVLST